jgi:SAM-dependent methyltransferase
VQAYDRLAPHYRGIARARASYLDAVDRYVVAHARRGGQLLDVGSGDGVRAVAIAQAIEASCLVLCEPSKSMHERCLAQPADEIWRLPAQSLPEGGGRFDVVTCLWNVLGHLPGRAARIAALSGMRRLLAAGGQIFCDVNNRHNMHAYGKARVMLRRLIDGIKPDDRRGDTCFEWVAGEARIPASGHLFTPREMRGLIAAAGLRVAGEQAVDYATGASSACLHEGQLVYRLVAADTRPRESQ